MDYSAVFEVPVFRTADSDPARLRGEVNDNGAIEPLTRIRIVPTASGTTAIVCPRPGWLAPWLAASALPLQVSGLVGVLLPFSNLQELVGRLAAGAFISVVIVGIVLVSLLMNRPRLEVRGDRLDVIRGLGVFRTSTRIVRGVVSDFTFDAIDSGRRTRYAVKARLTTGSSPTIAYVRTPEQAGWLIANLRRLLGVAPAD